ncbi:MAG: hypothetical protein U1E45_04915 [Geminicoccaceae bacterium]
MTTETLTPSGPYALTRLNALRHGLLSRSAVLPWEDRTEYDQMLAALVSEHEPQGPTEEHLVEEIAGIFWRKRRLRTAEAASHQEALRAALEPFRDSAKAALSHLDVDHRHIDAGRAIRLTEDEAEDELTDLNTEEAQIHQATAILSAAGTKRYQRALAALPEAARDWWHDELDAAPEERSIEDETMTKGAASLARFIEEVITPWIHSRRAQLLHRPLIREHTFGETLNVRQLERLARYEVHLDRKLERMLAMLFRLKDLRRESDNT